ncbi:MAG: leucine--tRNA ligase [Candidatus Spechtbacteria bacterium]|nr:leucine--tRNA ligase [Candidatus Spechtbacteria bacterium]
MKEYNPIEIEKRWREKWEGENRWHVDMNKAERPYYNLMMFPYPSAEGLHIGNVYAFTGADIHGRYQRMRGNDVFEPMGFDAFGIHSENFAIKKGLHPRDLTEKNVNNFRDQLKKMGALFDWTHEVDTSKPEYYKWTQWLFLQLYKNGLAYKSKAAVDWCPGCKTVLADEQVIGGKCERCDSVVVQRELEQWFFKITDYAERLLKNLEIIDWSESVKLIQKNWIGRSDGAEIEFRIQNTEYRIKVFTTRPDTLFGATYVVLAPEHDLVQELKNNIENWSEVDAYIKATQGKSELERMEVQKEKTGVELKGVRAINPATKEEVPVWIADYVLKTYGTGAIMAVPAHDQRDFEFAKEHNLPVVMVICPNYPAEICPVLDEAYEGEGKLVASGKFNGMTIEEAKSAITEYVGGVKKINYHLRDWLISRQRYWGPPIPIIYCPKCALQDPSGQGIVPVPEKDLPVLLPYVENFHPTGTDESPLATVEEFVNTTCPKCGGAAKRETDVSDTFLDSAWYFLRYPSTRSARSGQVPFESEITKKWLPVNMYIGGKEHSVLHLLYARFITMALHDIGVLDFSAQGGEPFTKFRANGLLIKDGNKMSKSRGNVVNPDEYFASYGVDVTRMYLMFLAPFQDGGDWRDEGVRGISRFAKRAWQLAEGLTLRGGSDPPAADIDMERIRHKTIKRVTQDIEKLQYNTAISALMEYVNAISNLKIQSSKQLETLIVLLAPFAPHLAEELWQATNHDDSVHDQSWPTYDEAMLKKEIITLPVQINGKMRGIVEVAADVTEDDIKNTIIHVDFVEKWLAGKEVKKWIIVPGRLVNIIVI